METIEGRITQGTVSVDGSSAVRRTCSLTLVAQDFNYNDYYWGLNTKFKLEIGIENHVDEAYPDIIWFKQGIFLITSFNTSRSVNSFTINLQGKDKMCLLNGDVGGSLESSVDFGTIQEEDQYGNWSITKIPIQDIIKNLLHTYGGEPYYNIIINDLDTYGLELMEYRYTVPMFLYRQVDNAIYTNVALGGTHQNCKVFNIEDLTTAIPIKIKHEDGTETTSYSVKMKDLPFQYLEPLTDRLLKGANDSYVIGIDGSEAQNKFYHLAKVDYGQTAGYRLSDLVYGGDLIANAGESVTSVLDKIKNMLGEFEYFYNLDGQFVFQKKRSLKECLWYFNKDENKTQTPPDYSYEFFGTDLITALTNNPNLLNLRNDYSIWGEREGIAGGTIPVHIRYAIDKKPIAYNAIWTTASDDKQIEEYNNKHGTTLQGRSSTEAKQLKFTTEGDNGWDWREIIYQMAMDYYKYNILDEFELRVAEANPELYPTGRTGYEQYYTDMQGFWRDLYNPDILIQEAKLIADIDKIEQEIGLKIAEMQQYNTIIQGFDKYTTDLFEDAQNKSEEYLARDTASTNLQAVKEELIKLEDELDLLKTEKKKISEQASQYYHEEESSELRYWNIYVHSSPEVLNFWIDFLDTEGELQQFSVKSIGARPKVVNDKDVKSIYFRETPAVIYGENVENKFLGENDGFRYIQVSSSYENMFSISAQGKGAKDKLDELLYEHGYCIETATINTIPIYHLEPNTRIYLQDIDTGLDGDYIINKISIPLLYNATMQLTLTKAAENIIR